MPLLTYSRRKKISQVGLVCGGAKNVYSVGSAHGKQGLVGGKVLCLYTCLKDAETPVMAVIWCWSESRLK